MSDPANVRVRSVTKVLVVIGAGAAFLYSFPNAAPATETTGPILGDAAMAATSRVFKDGPIGQAVLYIGLWQYWSMFAPNPSRQDQWLDATVTRADGSVATVAFPRMTETPVLQRYFRERYRKWLESGGSAQHAYLWPALAQWMAQRADDPANPPREVLLQLHYRITPEVGQSPPLSYQTEPFFRYIVDTKRLVAWRQASGQAR